MRRTAGFIAMLLAAIALAATDRAVASPADQLYPINLRVEGGEGDWHPDFVFSLEWERPPIADQGFPITAVGYRLRDAETELLREHRLAGDRSSIPHLQVLPIPGVYTVELWLEGPGGKRGPAIGATLRYDQARPGTPRPTSAPGWIAGSSAATISIQPPSGPPPVSGIRGYAVSIDRGGETWPCAARDRCSPAEIDLPADLAASTLSLGTLPEGSNTIGAVAVSGAGVASAESGRTVVRVDATPPEVVVAGAPGGWSNGPVPLLARASDALSGMTPGGPNGPFTAIAVDGAAPRVERGDSAAATVSGEGVHRVDSYARDAAGNVDADSPDPTAVSIDESPPRVAFVNAQDPAEPERIEAGATDELAGIDPDRGSVGVREVGASGAWRTLPTRATAGRLVAHWDSDSWPPGVYEFRATAYDRAGNASSSNQRANHTRMVLVNPLKQEVRLQAAFADVLPASTVAYRRRVLYTGRLTASNGAPLGAQPIQIVETFGPGAAVPQRSTSALTAADGRFVVRLPRGPSRLVEARFAGTRTLGAANGDRSRLEVRAAVSLRASAEIARVGGAPVVFSGRVGGLGAGLPAGRLPVELQFKVPGGDWADFRTVQTDRRGRFRYAYAFSDDDSRGVRFQFRACISGGDWPYEPAASRSLSILGR